MFASIAHQSSCASLLAYTAKTFLPILQPIIGQAHVWGFHYDFLCEGSVDNLVLTLLTEQMRRNISADLPFQQITMVPKNAAQFLQREQPLQADLVSEIDAPIVELAKIANFYDISSGDLLSSTKEIQDFVLLDIEKKEAFYEGIGECDIIRIYGTVANEKKALKEYIKSYRKSKPTPLCKVQDGYPTWYPEGLEFYDKVIAAWKNLCQKQSIVCISSPSHDTKNVHIALNFRRSGEWKKVQRELLPQDCEGLFQTRECFQDLIFRKCTHDQLHDELISSLQFIQELLSIFKLDTTFVLVPSRAKKMQPIQEKLAACILAQHPVLETSTENSAKPRLEIWAEDARKHRWLVAFVAIEEIVDILLITQSTVFSMERLLALHLEGGYKKA